MQTKNSTNNSNSAWWTFKNLQNKGNINYTQSFSSIQKSLQRDHDSLLLQKKDIEKRTIELLKSAQTDQAISILNAFSLGQSEISLTRAHNFLEHMNQIENDKKK